MTTDEHEPDLPPGAKERLYNVREASAKAGGTERIVTALVDYHRIPYFIAGKHRLFDEAGIAAIREAVSSYNNRPKRIYYRPKATAAC